MQVDENSLATENKNKPKKGLKLNLHWRRNWLVQIEELAARIASTVSDLQLSEQRTRTPR